MNRIERQQENAVNTAIQKALYGVTVSMLDLSKMSREVREAVEKGEPPQVAADRIVPFYQVAL